MPTENTTISQEVVSGSVAGFTEVFVDNPLWTIKTRMQSHQPFSWSPRVLYRGMLPNAASMVPITAIQMAVKQAFQNVFFLDSPNHTSQHEVVSAYAGGVFAATVACPVEMVMTHMKEGEKFTPTARALIKQAGPGHIYSGFTMTAMRDGFFAVGFMAAPKVLKPMFRSYVKSDNQASLFSKVAAGVGAAVVSQAFDTVKTVQQASEKGMRLFDAAKKPYANHGVAGYFRGGLPRGVRVASAVCIMSSVNEHMNAFFKSTNEVENNDKRVENTRSR